MAPIFVKFDELEGEAHQVRHGLDQLATSFEDLGDGFMKLVFDGTTMTGDLKIAPEIKFDHDIKFIGAQFNNIGFDFIKLADSQHKFDSTFLNFTDQFLAPPTTGDGPPPNPLSADFKFYEADLKATSLDFLTLANTWKFDSSPDFKFNPSELADAFHKISQDFLALKYDEVAIGGDFFKLSGLTDAQPLGQALFKYDIASQALGDGFNKLSVDWQTLAHDVMPSTDTATVKLDQFQPSLNNLVLQHASDFAQMATDLTLLGPDFRAVGGDGVRVAEAIQQATHSIKFASS
jgi:hypothetical protein